MSKAVRRGRTDRETLEVLNPFLSVLRSSDDISIPKETLQGALGHFTSTLVGDRLDSFIQDVLSSPSLWKTLQPHQIQAAVRPAPKIKVEALRPTVKDGWIFRNQLDKAAQTWLTEVVKAMKTTPTSSHSLILLIGLLQGLDDVTDIKWGRPRIDLEEEIVIAIGERLDNNSCDLLDMYCPAADHIDSARLRALDLRVSTTYVMLVLTFSKSFLACMWRCSQHSATPHRPCHRRTRYSPSSTWMRSRLCLMVSPVRLLPSRTVAREARSLRGPSSRHSQPACTSTAPPSCKRNGSMASPDRQKVDQVGSFLLRRC